MEQLHVHQRQDRLLLWMVLGCLVTVVRSDRVMWVDTKGVDGPQCIHDTPEGVLMAQPPPNRSCGSLLYALQNTLNTTSIIVTCGTHEYFKTADKVFPANTLNVRIVGKCATKRPTVQFMNGSNVTFHGITGVVVRELVIETYGKQGGLQVDKNNPALYISNCTNVRIQNTTISIMSSHRNGISLRHTAVNGEIILYNVSILHSGTHGIGIHCDILINAQSTTDHLTLNMTHILVANTNTATTYEPSMVFTGIAITTRGTGSGNKIAMHNITVFNSAPVTGFGILVRSINGVHNSTVTLAGVNVFDGWDKRYHNRGKDEVLADCSKRQHDMLNMTKAVLRNYLPIMVDVWTSQNRINVTDVQVTASYAPSGSAIAVYFKGLSKLNSVFLGNVSLAATGNTITHRQGLDLQFAGNASENEVIAQDLRVANSTTAFGGGTHLLFTERCTRNTVLLSNSTFTNHSSRYGGGLCALFQGSSQNNVIGLPLMDVKNNTAELGGGVLIILDDFSSGNFVVTGGGRISGNGAIPKGGQPARSMFKNHTVPRYGGGLAVLCLGHAQNNSIFLERLVLENNTAEQGGGMMILLDDFARGNVITMQGVDIVSNKAYIGGGIYIKFHHSSQRNTVALSTLIVINNVLIPHANFITKGGGVDVEFDTYKATSATNNAVLMKGVVFAENNARNGVGGGLSVLYVHSPHIRESGDKVRLDSTTFSNNQAANGQAIALQSLPKYRKALFTGVTFNDTFIISLRMVSLYRYTLASAWRWSPPTSKNYFKTAIDDLLNVQMPELMRHRNPIHEVNVNRNMILLVSVQVRIENSFSCICGGLSQGVLAIDSEITLQPKAFAIIYSCVASHGGAVALYGQSYMRFPLSYASTAQMILYRNHAFQRGGALYVDSKLGVQSRFHCFLQTDQGQTNSSSVNGIIFQENSAELEGQSVYISDAQSCSNSNAMNQLLFVRSNHSCYTLLLNFKATNSCVFQLYRFQEEEADRQFRKCYGPPIQNCTKSEKFLPVSQELFFYPSHVDGAPDNLSPVNVQFIPGIPKQLPFTHAHDKLGNIISTVFIVQVISQEATLTAPVQLDPFSKFTADFKVILHGVPLQHGRFNNSFNTNSSNTSGTAPLLVLQSVDNQNLLLIVNIMFQCCPPGYTFQYNSDDAGTCHCGMLTVKGIAECHETNPNATSAVLQRDHWAGYLPSNDHHSCDGQKLFSAPCPPGYCQTQQTILPNNNSRQLLEKVVCGGSKRKGLLCGDCLDGNSIAVNFNGIIPVCVSCQEGLSRIGILVWILSEWVPMLILMFILMLFNVDLISGRFNSFLLFAQLLAFSTIRGNTEIESAHIAFVKIYRFLYGMWNLDFFGVLLPPYCLIPQAHLTLLQTLMLHYSIGLFPLAVAITLTVLERSAEKWICCHRVDQCLRRMRRWKAKYSDGMSYDRALPAFVILGFTRFLVSSAYILVNQTITGEDGEEKMVVWWQGSVPYGSIQHIAYFIPAIVILLVFVLLPSFLLLTLPIMPQLFGRLIIAVPPLRKLQRMQTFCSNVYTDRWVYHFVNVFQGCYKERYRSFSSLYLFHRIIQLFAAVCIPRAEDALRIQLILVLVLQLLIAIFQPYNSSRLNTLDIVILGNMALILVLSLLITDVHTPTEVKWFYTSVQMILIYLPLLYPGILFGRKVYIKCAQWRCCQKQEASTGDNAEPLLEDPAAGLGNLVNITELRAGLPTSADESEYSETATQSDI